MHCVKCGGTIQPGQNFCNRCGQATTPTTSATPAPGPPTPTLNTTAPAGASVAAAQYISLPQPSRVAKHLQILGIFWLIISGLRAIPALVLLCLGSTRLPFMAIPMRGFLDHEDIPVLGALGAFLAITAAVGILVGWGLISHQPWARMLAIVVGCLKLIEFPFGTALSIYTLWVLTSQGAEANYQGMARVS